MPYTDAISVVYANNMCTYHTYGYNSMYSNVLQKPLHLALIKSQPVCVPIARTLNSIEILL